MLSKSLGIKQCAPPCSAEDDCAVAESVPVPIDKESTMQAAALGDGCPPEHRAGHSDRGGHPPRD